MKKETLVKKVLANRRFRKISPKEIELAVAALKGEVSWREASKALGKKFPGSGTHWTSATLREAYILGLITIEIN